MLVRQIDGQWMVAAIRPAGKREGIWALPKGRIDEGESGEETALREVAEETGAHGQLISKLGDVKYWFNWDHERIFKIVSFFLVRYESGELGNVPDEFRHEVVDVQWLPLAEAPTLLAYDGEREMAQRAAVALAGENV